MTFTSDKLYGRQGGRVVPDVSAADRAYERWQVERAAREAADAARAEQLALDLFDDEPA